MTRRSRPASWALAGMVLLAPPLAASADPAPSPPLTVTKPAPDVPDMAARRGADRAAMLDARLDALHAGLRLTAAQEALWPPVAAAIRGFHEAHGVRFHQAMEAADTTIDALKMQGEHMARVGVAMGQLADATRPLVASLSPDQKSRLPTLLQRVRPRQVMARAFAVPADTGPAAGASGKGFGNGATQDRPAARAPKPDDDGEE